MIISLFPARSRRTATVFFSLWALAAVPSGFGQEKPVPGGVPAAVKMLVPNGVPAATKQLNVAIGLRVRNSDELNQFLAELYDPASPNYFRYLTPLEFTERFGPSPEDYDAVARFAEARGLTVTTRYPNRMVLGVAGTVADLERALQIKIRTYPHPTESRNFYAPDTDPMVDAALPILSISGLDNYSNQKPNLKLRPADTFSGVSPNSGSGPSGSYIGNDFRSAYVPGVSLAGHGQIVGLVEFDGYHANDITNYEQQAGLSAVPLQNVFVDGYNGSAGSGNSEVCLDIEVAISLAPALSEVIVYEAPNGSPWVDILNRIANDDAANQISCSWGGGGPDPTAEQIFQEMAAQGQSFFNATGDDDAFTGSIPFPSDSPNIIEVGGTTLSTASGTWSSETTWNWGFSHGSYTGSSGGISIVYSIPVWQQGINMSANQGSTTHRNVPDVALTADNVFVDYNNGSSGLFGGTSCAAPLWAAFTALVNEQAANNSRPPAGFLNPAIYAIGKGGNYSTRFHDIASGNDITGQSGGKFSAVSGYDLCTGWGTPTGINLINDLAGAFNGTPTPTPSVTPTATPTNGPAVMTSPGPGSTLPSSSVTFQWTAGSATAYFLTLGSTSKGSDIYSSGSLTTLSIIATNIPIDGRTVFATLYSKLNNTWKN